MTLTNTDRTQFSVNGAPASARSTHPHLLAALREELDVHVALRNLLVAPTIAGLSEIIDALRGVLSMALMRWDAVLGPVLVTDTYSGLLFYTLAGDLFHYLLPHHFVGSHLAILPGEAAGGHDRVAWVIVAEDVEDSAIVTVDHTGNEIEMIQFAFYDPA